MSRDTPPVNDPTTAVIDALSRQLQLSALAWRSPPAPLSGGFWAEMWVGELVDGPRDWPERVVVRMAPDVVSATRETAIQAAVADLGYPTPSIRASGLTADLGRPWSVMDFVSGRPLLDGLDGLAAIRALPRIARELPEHLGAMMARLHALPTAGLHAELEVVAPGTAGIDGYVDYLGREIDRVEATRLRVALTALRRDPPESRPDVICHGDLHPFNVLIAERGPVVIDWTAARIAHPAYDVACTSLLLEVPPLIAPAPVARVVTGAARILARRFRSRYLKYGGVPFSPSTLRWFEDLAAIRILLEVAQWRDREGADPPPGHPFLTMAPTLELRLASRQ